MSASCFVAGIPSDSRYSLLGRGLGEGFSIGCWGLGVGVHGTWCEIGAQ